MIVRFNDERGIALVVVMLVMMVLVALSVAVVEIATGSGKLAGFDQRRVESAQGAEEGLATYLQVLPTGVGTDSSGKYKLCALQGQKLTVVNPAATYKLDIKLFTGEKGTGTRVGCADEDFGTNITYAGQTNLKSAVITARATAGKTTRNSIGSTRTLQQMVNLSPRYGQALMSAVYGARRVVIENNTDILSYQNTNDANIYAGDLGIYAPNDVDIQGSLNTQGVVVAKGCIEGNIHAVGDIDLSGAKYVGGCNRSTQPGAEILNGVSIYFGFGNVTSSSGNITFSAGTKAYGTCTKAAGTRTDGSTAGSSTTSSIVTGKCSRYLSEGVASDPASCGEPADGDATEPCGYIMSSNPPVDVSFPNISFDKATWQGEGWTVHDYTDCTTARTALQDYLNHAVATDPLPKEQNGSYWSAINVDPDGGDVINLLGASTTAAGCPMTLPGSTSYTMTGNLALILNGSFETDGVVAIDSSAEETPSFFVMRPVNGTRDLSTRANRDAYCGADPGISAPPPNSPASLPDSGVNKWPFDLRFSVKTDMAGINFLAYTPCNIRTYNQNKSGNGQLIAGQTVYIANSYKLGFLPINVPGQVPVGFIPQEVFTREIQT